MLVSLGAALFVIAVVESGMDNDGVSLVLQGLVTGIGFLGGGAILKWQQQRELEGLTTAAGIWLMAAVGVAVGLGRLGLATVGTILTWIIMSWVGRIEHRINARQSNRRGSANPLLNGGEKVNDVANDLLPQHPSLRAVL